jgi:hypothetical protein
MFDASSTQHLDEPLKEKVVDGGMDGLLRSVVVLRMILE